MKLSDRAQEHIEVILSRINFKISDSKRLSEAIVAHSDYYIDNPNSTTPWTEPWAPIAQAAYYLPLNYLRALRVFGELKRVFDINDFDQIVDYGSGLGAASLAAVDSGYTKKLIQFEPYAPDLLYKPVSEHAVRVQKPHWPVTTSTLGVFSYSLTETSDPISLAEQFETLLIIEPSTQKEGRKLSNTRQKLIDKGYQILAPCTHQGKCPLLMQSEKDWCHDRMKVELPPWMKTIEKQLPMKNETLTFSYLIATKAVHPHKTLNTGPKLARTIGDHLDEKGKSRQLVCADERRLFLTWMHKFKLEQEIPRGTLIEWPTEAEIVSNEVRVKKLIQCQP